jgi:hypothetical protein
MMVNKLLSFLCLIFTSKGIKHERNLTKMRLLTFLQIAENQKEITFDAVEKEMQIPSDDIESFMIEGKNFFEKYFS